VFIKTAFFLFAISVLSFGQALPEGRLMRFPDIHGDKIAFSYGGDLWLAARDGGVARRITTHPGQELFPKFSPDGKWIAFTGQYDGNYNVYIIPAEGGAPKQLTFHPGGDPLSERMGIHNEVINWFPDSKRILFLSRRDTYNTWFGRLYSISIDGGLPERRMLGQPEIIVGGKVQSRRQFERPVASQGLQAAELRIEGLHRILTSVTVPIR